MGVTTVAALVSAGVDAGTAATIAGVAGTAAEGAGIGAGIGGIGSEITGGNPWQGALHGAEAGGLTGGGASIGGDLLGSTIGATAGSTVGGAAGGLASSPLTGTKPLIAAGEGAAGGFVQGGGLDSISNMFSGTSPTPATSAAPGTPGAVNAASAAPAGISGAPPAGAPAPAGIAASPDVSNPIDTSQFSNFVSSNTTTPAVAPSANSGTFTPSLSQTGGLDVSGASTPGATGANITNPFSAPTGTTGAPSPASGVAATTGNSGVNLIKDIASGNNIGSGLGDFLSSNAGLAPTVAGLGVDALKQNQMLKGERQLEQQAGAQGAQGAQLENYLATGTLPTGLQDSLNQTADSAKAAIRSRYAQMGSSGSSAEQQELASVDQQVQAQGAQYATNLLNSGITESQMSSNLYKSIMDNALSQDNALSSALASFGAAAAGGTGGGGNYKLVPAGANG